jgi:regulator of protease activity HflC (stomatin/prohibitin superfamily)
VSVRVDAVVYFRVVDPVKAIVNVQNYGYAVSQVSQTSLRSVIGKADMQQLLSERDTINAELRAIMDAMTEGPWGIKIERVEIKDVSLPEGMKRSMARQAEAERERRARIITADGEYQASKRLAAAARELSTDPASLQLRLLQTVTEVAAEKNSTLVMPLPVEMLRFFDRMSGGTPASGETQPEPQPEPEVEEPAPIESADEVPPVEAPEGLELTAAEREVAQQRARELEGRSGD